MIPFLRTLFFFVVFWAHQILILPLLLLFSILVRDTPTRTAQRRSVHLITHSWARMICWLGGVKLQVMDRSGVSRDETVLWVSNHQGDFDIPILLATAGRPTAFVAKKELSGIPLVSRWMSIMGCIFLDRQNRRKQVEQVKQAVAHLQGGISMVIFPEGTRSHGPQMGEFAKGSLQIGLRAGVPIVPVTLRDTYTLYPKSKKLFPGGTAAVIFHPAIPTSDLTPEERTALQTRVQEQIQKGLDES